jgi:hypothetical protein
MILGTFNVSQCVQIPQNNIWVQWKWMDGNFNTLIFPSYFVMNWIDTPKLTASNMSWRV